MHMYWVVVLAYHTGFMSAERCANSTEKALHQGGDGQSLDGEEPVQGEADGAAGGCQMDRDDPVRQEAQRLQEVDNMK